MADLLTKNVRVIVRLKESLKQKRKLMVSKKMIFQKDSEVKSRIKVNL